jgi:hypothetical protein
LPRSRLYMHLAHISDAQLQEGFKKSCPSGKRAQPGFFSFLGREAGVGSSLPWVGGTNCRVLMSDGSGRCQTDSKAT